MLLGSNLPIIGVNDYECFKRLDFTGTAKDYAKKQFSLILTSLNEQLCNEM